jgi:hypothetical protein
MASSTNPRSHGRRRARRKHSAPSREHGSKGLDYRDAFESCDIPAQKVITPLMRPDF